MSDKIDTTGMKFFGELDKRLYTVGESIEKMSYYTLINIRDGMNKEIVKRNSIRDKEVVYEF